MDTNNILNQIANHIVKEHIKSINNANYKLKEEGYRIQENEITFNEIKKITGTFIYKKYMKELEELLIAHKKICSIGKHDGYYRIMIYDRFLARIEDFER